METFKSIGFWREFHNNVLFPSIFDSIKNTSILEEKNQILSYLKSGKYVLGRRNMLDCPISGRQMFPQAIYTDGKWIWTSELVYYIRSNDIEVNPDFIQYIKNKSFIFPEVETSNIAEMKSEVKKFVNYDENLPLMR